MRRAALPLVALTLIVILSVLAPWIAPYDPLDESGDSLEPPSVTHRLGTDLIGRDVFSRVLHGGARTLVIAVLALGLSVLPGLIIGMLAGYVGGFLDNVVVAGLDGFLAIPGLLIALSVMALTGSGPAQVAVAVGVAGMPAYARGVWAAARTIRVQPYIEAAKSIGARPLHIIWRHILPNMLRPLIAFGTVALSWAILNAATLHFLGFGGDPAAPEWGAMLADGRNAYRIAPWVIIGPGAAIMITLLAINALADTTN